MTSTPFVPIFMSILRRLKKRATIVLLLAGSALVAVFVICERSKSWTEEVRLSNGSIILIERTTYYRNYSENRLGFGSTEDANSLRILNSDMVVRQAVWKAKLIPILLDLDRELNAFVIVAIPLYCYGVLEYSLFILEANGWRPIQWDNRFVGRKANLAMSDDVAIDRLTIQDKLNLDDNPNRFIEFRQVLGNGRGC